MIVAQIIGLLFSIPLAFADDRVVGGAPADIADYPYLVALETEGYQICGGSIISPDRVLTAAHCVNDTSADDLQIRTGSSYRTYGGYITPVKSISIHPKWNDKTLDYDAAILTLSAPVTWGESISLRPSLEGELPMNSQGRVAGWGTLRDNGPQPLQLHAVSVPLVSHEECNADYPGQVTDRMICFGAEGIDACHGDSGGGIVSGGRLVGIVSWGIGCAAPSHSTLAFIPIFITQRYNLLFWHPRDACYVRIYIYMRVLKHV